MVCQILLFDLLEGERIEYLARGMYVHLVTLRQARLCSGAVWYMRFPSSHRERFVCVCLMLVVGDGGSECPFGCSRDE